MGIYIDGTGTRVRAKRWCDVDKFEEIFHFPSRIDDRCGSPFTILLQGPCEGLVLHLGQWLIFYEDGRMEAMSDKDFLDTYCPTDDDSGVWVSPA